MTGGSPAVTRESCGWGGIEYGITGMVNRWLCFCQDQPVPCPNRPEGPA